MKSFLNKVGFNVLQMSLAYLGFFHDSEWALFLFWVLFWAMMAAAAIGHLLIRSMLKQNKSITPPRKIGRGEKLFNVSYDFALSLLLVYVGYPIEGFIWVFLSQYTKLTFDKLIAGQEASADG